MFQAYLSAVLALGAVAEHAAAPSSFMLVSGATSAQETCLVASESVGAVLEPCASAASKLDGREIWSLAPDGSLTSSGSTKCLGSADGKKLGLFACNGLPSDSKWELQGNGQIKLASSNICLSQSGLAPGLSDAARSSSVIASSTLDAAHGAKLTVDGLASTYWVSKLDEPGPVSLMLAMAEPLPIAEVVLDFEFVPSAFAVQVSPDGRRWKDVFSTETNCLRNVRVQLASEVVYGVKVVMTKAHGTHGVLGGRELFGVRAFKALAPEMRATLEPCGAAAKSQDARDKYFAVAVGSFDPSAASGLVAEIPALEAAASALAAVSVELAAAEAHFPSCKRLTSLKALVRNHQEMASSPSTSFDAATNDALLAEARRSIVAARGTLHR